MIKLVVRLKGGPGSGHYGHSGRPGEVGGSKRGNSYRTPRNDRDELLKDYLTQVNTLRGNAGKSKGWAYNSYEDMVLKHGKFYTPPTTGELPEFCDRGEAKECFRNAFVNISDDLAYTEGYAVTKVLPIPMPHGWLTTKDGTVVDPTWTDGTPYFGIRFSNKFAYSTMIRTGFAGIIVNDYLDDARLIREGFPEGAMI